MFPGWCPTMLEFPGTAVFLSPAAKSIRAMMEVETYTVTEESPKAGGSIFRKSVSFTVKGFFSFRWGLPEDHLKDDHP